MAVSIPFYSQAQTMGIGTENPDSTAVLDISGIGKGLLIPRMKATERMGIHLPANGLFVYDLDSSSLFIYQKDTWRRLTAISSLGDLLPGTATNDVLMWDGAKWVVTPLNYIYRDVDGDGHGDKYKPLMAKLPFAGFVADSLDCDDANPIKYGTATEVCDGIDNDCDGLVDEAPNNVADIPDDNFTDQNGDGIDGTECAAIFVSASGNNANAGTKSQPVQSITAGISKAIALGKTQVYVSKGTFLEKLTLSNGISIYGGYDAGAGWSRSAGNITEIYVYMPETNVMGVQGNAITLPTTLDRMTITTDNATGSGRNNYGVYCNGCTGLALKNLVITAGKGSAGLAGAEGIAGSNGAAGNNGSNGNCSGSSGGAGGGVEEQPVHQGRGMPVAMAARVEAPVRVQPGQMADFHQVQMVQAEPVEIYQVSMARMETMV